MWQRFTERARKVVFYAQEEAGRLGENYVSTEHLLLGLIREDDSVAARILDRLSIPLLGIRTAIEQQVERGDGRLGQDMQLTPRAKRVIDLAYDEARQLNNNYIGTEHLLLGLIREGEGLAGRILSDLGVTLDSARLEVLRLQGAGKDEILSFDQAMQLLGVSKATLYRLLNQEEIKGLKAGRQWRFSKADIFAYLERGKAGTQQAAASKAMDELLRALDTKLDVPSGNAPSQADKETQATRLLLEPAIEAHASVIHFEPQAEGFSLRYRVGGKLQTVQTLPMPLGSVLRHFKQASGLNVDETQLPQQGRFVYQSAQGSADTIPVEKAYEIAVATLPTLSGEALTLQLTEKRQQLLTLETIGLTEYTQAALRMCLMQSDDTKMADGLIMVIGPKQSGKTTFLQALAQEIVQADTKTLWLGRVPDGLPSGITTVISPDDAAALAGVLQGIKQSDPDHILIDGLTGTNAAWQTIGLALDHGVIVAMTAVDISDLESLLFSDERERLALAHVLRGMMTVRLVRRLCPECKRPETYSDKVIRTFRGNVKVRVTNHDFPAIENLLRQAAEFGYPVPEGTVFYTTRGCDQCSHQGYQGYIGLFDLRYRSGNVTDLLPHGQADSSILSESINGLAADGVRKAAEGLTTLDEVLRVISLPNGGLP